MAGNKKPRKAYKPKANGTPILFRHGGDDERTLQLIPHLELAKLREGTMEEGGWHTLTVRCNIGSVMADTQKCHEYEVVMSKGLDALVSIWNRWKATGKFGGTGDELTAIGNALATADQIQLESRRKELRDAMRLVHKVAAV